MKLKKDTTSREGGETRIIHAQREEGKWNGETPLLENIYKKKERKGTVKNFLFRKIQW